MDIAYDDDAGRGGIFDGSTDGDLPGVDDAGRRSADAYCWSNG